jgi:eukaryotic-like serine/threonine-protein kinase
VPAGWRRYSDTTGFSVAVPDAWRVERRGQRVYLRDPGSSAYLLVDQTTDPAPDPVADWRAQERVVSKRLSGYHLVGIRPVTVRGWRGADWEFTHGGTHVLNRALVTAPDQAYALYWSAPDARWQRSLGDFRQVVASFPPRA